MSQQPLNIASIKVESRAPKEAGLALFSLGFRPFFLLASSFAVVQVLIWLSVYVSGAKLVTYYGALLWHGHEMIFGYATAVIAGFLLTAVPNWTRIPTPNGIPLAALASLWVAARVLPFFSATVPHWFIAAVDIAFLPVLIGVLAVPLLRVRQRHNLVFLLLLSVFVFANVMMHLEALEVTSGTARAAIDLAVNLIVLLIVLIGGRVIPSFAERALAGVNVKRWPAVEAGAFGTVILSAVAALVYPNPSLLTLLAALAFITHGIRLSGWYSNRIWNVPILWVLYLGYGWLVVGFALQSFAMQGVVSKLFSLHAFTVGAIGVLTLGMMARVALGHTGRAMKAAKPMVLAFIFINFAAFVRVVLPIAFSEWYLYFIGASGVLWIAAFSIFTYLYTPILIRPRVDAQP